MVSRKVKLVKARKRLRLSGRKRTRKFQSELRDLNRAIRAENIKSRQKLAAAQARGEAPQVMEVRPGTLMPEQVRAAGVQKEVRAPRPALEATVREARTGRLVSAPRRVQVIVEETRVRQAIPVATAGIPITTRVQVTRPDPTKPRFTGELRAFRPEQQPQPTFLGITEPRVRGLPTARFQLQKRAERAEFEFQREPTLGGAIESIGTQIALAPLRLAERPLRTAAVTGALLLGGAIAGPKIGASFLAAQAPQLGATEVLFGGVLAGGFAAGVEKERQAGRPGFQTAGETAFFAGLIPAARGVKRIAKGVRRVRGERAFGRLERGVMREQPFRITEEVIFEPGKPGVRGRLEEAFPQVDLFGRRISPAQVRASLRAPEIEQRLLFERITPEGRVRIRASRPSTLDTRAQRPLLPTEVISIEPTGVVRPVRVVEGQPFVQVAGRSLEFVPERGAVLRTVSPRPLARQAFPSQFSIVETAQQTRLGRFVPELRPPDAGISIRRLGTEISPLVRRPTPATPPAKLPKAPRVAPEGRATVGILQRGAPTEIFRPTVGQRTFLEVIPEPTPIAPPITELAPRTITGLGRIPTTAFGLARGQLRRQRREIFAIQALSVEQALQPALIQDINPLTGEIRIPRIKPRVKVAQAQIVKPIQPQIPDLLGLQVLAPVIPFPPSPPTRPSVDVFEPSRIRVPVAPFGLPSVPRLRRGRAPTPEFDPLGIQQEFVPTATAFTFGLFGTPEEEAIFTGLEQRRIPERLRRRLGRRLTSFV